MCGRPEPTDLLMVMSGDLGSAGYPDKVIDLCEPHFDPSVHGVMVGNNLIKAHLALGHLDDARRVLDDLYAQKRPDWQRQLGFWDSEIADARVAAATEEEADVPGLGLMTIGGPIWTRNESPFAALLPEKSDDAPLVAIVGSSALEADPSDVPMIQLATGPGRLSRAVPLIMAEAIHVSTDAAGLALLPYVPDGGFVLFGTPYEDQALCEVVVEEAPAPDLLVTVSVDARLSVWLLDVHLLRPSDAQRLAETTVEADAGFPGAAAMDLTARVLDLVRTYSGARAVAAPDWYEVPRGQDTTDYLLRLEQQLAVTLERHSRGRGGGLTGERAMLDGALQLCLRQPANATVRMVFAQTLRLMSEVRADIVPEFEDKVRRLQREHPLTGAVGARIDTAIDDALGA